MSRRFDIEPLTDSEHKFAQYIFDVTLDSAVREIAVSRQIAGDKEKRKQLKTLIREAIADYYK